MYPLENMLWQLLNGPLIIFSHGAFLLQLLLGQSLLVLDALLDLLDGSFNLDFHIGEVELFGNELAIPTLEEHDVLGFVVGLLVDDSGDVVGVFLGGPGGSAGEGAGGVHEAGCVDLVQGPGGVRLGEAMLEQKGEVAGASEGLPMRPGAVEDVEEGQVGNYGHEHKGRSKWHDDDAPDQPPPVEGLAVLCQLLEDAGDACYGQVAAREQDIVTGIAVANGLLALWGEGGNGLETPLFKRDA